MTDATHEVKLRVYDLSQGMAKQMSMAFLGKQVDGIWHTGVLVYGYEYFYGGGIQVERPHVVEASFGIRPVQEIVLGRTGISKVALRDFLRGIKPRFTPDKYDLFRNNCNNFSNEVATFLLGTGIPAHIINLPNEVLATPLGKMIAPMVSQMQQSMYGSVTGTDPFGSFAPSSAVDDGGKVEEAVVAPRASPLAASSVLPTSKPFVSADAAVVAKVIKRLADRGAISEEERGVVESCMADSGAGASGDTAALCAILERICAATDKVAAPALCLLKEVVLHDDVLTHLLSDESKVLATIVSHLGDGTYTTVTPTLMALATLSNLVTMPAAMEHLAKHKELQGKIIDHTVQQMSAERAQVRQMASAVLHNLAFVLPAGDDLSDDMVQVLCSAVEGVADESDDNTATRRLKTAGRVVIRGGAAAAGLLSAIGALDALDSINTSTTHKDSVRALAREVADLARSLAPE